MTVPTGLRSTGQKKEYLPHRRYVVYVDGQSIFHTNIRIRCRLALTTLFRFQKEGTQAIRITCSLRTGRATGRSLISYAEKNKLPITMPLYQIGFYHNHVIGLRIGVNRGAYLPPGVARVLQAVTGNIFSRILKGAENGRIQRH